MRNCKDKQKCIICDLDNVLFDSRELLKLLPSKKDIHELGDRKAWDEFQKHTHLCKQNEIIIDIVEELTIRHKVIFLTGREENIRKETRQQIIDSSEFSLLYDWLLVMRKEDDYRLDYIVKEELLINEILPHYNPVLAIDDMESNINMFKKYGIDTMLYKIGDR